MGDKHRSGKSKKRRFHGNRHTAAASNSNASKDGVTESASAAKLSSSVMDFEVIGDDLEGFRFLDVTLLKSFVLAFACIMCKRSLESGTFAEQRSGLHSTFTVTCICQHVITLFSSNLIPNKKVREVNRLFPYAITSIGKNHQQAAKFLACMNMPSISSKVSWNKHIAAIHCATKDAAVSNMKAVAEELKQDVGEEVTVSCDGTWQRRGFASKNGVATVISVNGPNCKVLDVETLSNYCSSCAKARKTMSEEDLEKWQATHADCCQKNHEGSAGAMEPAGMSTIFCRSRSDRGLDYVNYLGDGDSKAFAAVQHNAPYSVAKLECCGHVQKRMGKRLMDTVSSLKGKTFTDDKGKKSKGIGGAGKLTQKAIKRIQGHYGGAIRSHPGDLKGMKKAIWAIWKHRGDDHRDCGEWCPHKQGKPVKNCLPKHVLLAIKPVFEALTKEDLLKKCLHGGSQNPNESFHHLIWERCPKTNFVGRRRLELGVYDAVLVFNGGEVRRLQVLNLLGIQPSQHAAKFATEVDCHRIKMSVCAGDIESIESRRKKSASVTADDANYCAGGF